MELFWSILASINETEDFSHDHLTIDHLSMAPTKFLRNQTMVDIVLTLTRLNGIAPLIIFHASFHYE